MEMVLIQFFVAVLKLLAAIVLSVGAIYSGIGIFDRMTRGIDEWKELRKGNAAVGILFAAVIISMMLLVSPRIEQFVFYIQPFLPVQTTLLMLAFTFINYLLDVLLSLFIIYLTLNLFDRLTVGLDEMEALKKGNVAVALMIAALLLGVVLAVRVPLDYTFQVVSALEALIFI
jgi:uncharacterized membrane protein YjfL (UPF0719 family)